MRRAFFGEKVFFCVSEGGGAALANAKKTLLTTFLRRRWRRHPERSEGTRTYFVIRRLRCELSCGEGIQLLSLVRL